MSILTETDYSNYQSSRKRKIEKRDREEYDKYEDVTVVGYHCKLFRDDVMAKYIDEGKHLIPWMGDETLLIDRYDCRGYLYSQEEFTLNGENVEIQLTPEEQSLEMQCDKERYLALKKDLTEEEFLEEEERKRFRTQYDPTYLYSNVGLQYDNDEAVSNSGDEEYDPSACFEDENDEDTAMEASPIHETQAQNTDSPRRRQPTVDEPFGVYVKPDSLELPQGMDVPDSQKAHSIIEKTALFISKQGTQMEIILKAKQSGNPQFDFLSYGNWLNPYYKFILRKIQDGSYVPTTSAAPCKQNEDKNMEDSTAEESEENSDDNEYIHPLLQAHRRPIKTIAKPTPATSSIIQSNSSSSSHESVLSRDRERNVEWTAQLHRSKMLKEHGRNAAAVYMARKYENSMKSVNSPLSHEQSEEKEENEEDDWANQLEEDCSYYSQDGGGFSYLAKAADSLASQTSIHPSLAMMSLMLPPPPPGQDTDGEFNNAFPGPSIPPPPPPPGCSDPDIPDDSGQLASTLEGATSRQPQHIVPPPPDLKPVVDKLAEYVSRNGEEFEEQIKKKNDPRFEFLRMENIYFPYYLFKKQHFLFDMAKKNAEENKEKAAKPLSFALQAKKKPRSIIKRSKTVEVFKENEEESNSENESIAEPDGYRPNQVKRAITPHEKAQMTMQEAKRLIAEAKQKQKDMQALAGNNSLQGDSNVPVERERQMQMERRRKAAAFIGKLKQSDTKQDSQSSSESSSDSDISEHDELSIDREYPERTKRHFQERITENSMNNDIDPTAEFANT